MQIVLAGCAVRRASSAVGQTQRVALVDHHLVRAAVQRILHREGFGLVGSWISTHGLIAYFKVKLSSLNLRVQARSNVHGSATASVNRAIDVQVGSLIRAVRVIYLKGHLLDIAIGDLPARPLTIPMLHPQTTVAALALYGSQGIAIHREVQRVALHQGEDTVCHVHPIVA